MYWGQLEKPITFSTSDRSCTVGSGVGVAVDVPGVDSDVDGVTGVEVVPAPQAVTATAAVPTADDARRFLRVMCLRKDITRG